MGRIKSPLASVPTRWDQSHGSYIAGRAAIDGADQLAGDMDRKWGVDRLRLLVPTEQRERFDRQRYLFQAAIQHGSLEEVREQSRRMVNAWMALDGIAEAAGALKLDPAVWELPIEKRDGSLSVAVLVRSPEDAAKVIREGRQVTVYTLQEIGRLLGTMPAVNLVKTVWPGANIIRASSPVSDPLDAVRDPIGLDQSLEGDEVGL